MYLAYEKLLFWVMIPTVHQQRVCSVLKLMVPCFLQLILIMISEFSLPSFKVERKVVNQIAAAHEKDLIKNGCSLRIAVNYHKSHGSEDELAKSPSIQLQLISEGEKKDLNVRDFCDPELQMNW